jgi:hypothetical protein
LSASHCCGLKDEFLLVFLTGVKSGKILITLIFTRVSLPLGLAAFWGSGGEVGKSQRYLRLKPRLMAKNGGGL